MKTYKIEFHFNMDPFDFNHRKVSQWIEKVFIQHHKKVGEINIIFCSDPFLRKMNKKYLGHDYNTDIISFPLLSNPISGELYISVDRVNVNARKFKVEAEWELLRVIIHGILHLIGFKDKSSVDKKKMRLEEDKALAFYKDEFLKQDHYFDQVYDIVRYIPSGKVTSYGAIADYLSLGSARMVGWALNQLKGNISNVPAHRVVNVKGILTGRMMFGGAGKRMEKLLKDEGIKVKDNKVQNFEMYYWSPVNLD